MKKIKRVVVPIDDTEASKIATEQGAYFAKLLNVDVTLISINEAQQYVLSTLLENKLNETKIKNLDQVKQIAEQKGVNVSTELKRGVPADEIVNYTDDEDLIVMASHGRTGFNRFLLGSVSEEVLKRAPCSVMIIRPNEKNDDKEKIKDLI